MITLIAWIAWSQVAPADVPPLEPTPPEAGATMDLVQATVVPEAVGDMDMPLASIGDDQPAQTPATSQPAGRSLWFDDLPPAPVVSLEDQQAIAQAVWRTLRGETEQLPALPEIWQQDRQPRAVFISVSDGATRARIGIGCAPGLAPALLEAMADLDARIAPLVQTNQMKIDITAEVAPLSQGARRLDRSLHGLAFDRLSGLALLPEELIGHRLVTPDQRLLPARLAEYVARDPGRAQQFERLRRANIPAGYSFTTISFYQDEQGFVPLYRGHRRLRQAGPPQFQRAARQAGQYLTRSVGPDGRFAYLYHPDTDTTVGVYNILRHAGTVYAMLELYEQTQDEMVLAAARRAVDYLIATVRPMTIGNIDVLCVVEDREVKLGGNALTVLALTQYIKATGDREHLPLAQKLAGFMSAVQGDNGAFRVHKASYPEGRISDFVSSYYPGEAIFALLRLNQIDSDPRWIEVAARATRYLIEVRDAGRAVEQTEPDHWLLYGLSELYRVRPEPVYLDHARRVAAAVLLPQLLDPAAPDWRGGFFDPPRSTPTSTRVEGLLAAARLLRDAGELAQARSLHDAARLGGTFVLRTQIGPELAMYFPDPQRAIGGVRPDLTGTDLRIDYAQHAISAWLALSQTPPDDVATVVEDLER